METHQANNLFNDRPRRLPERLNVLTILTIIGCVLGYLGTCWGLYQSNDYENQMSKMQEKLDGMDAGSFSARMMEYSMKSAKLTHDNRYTVFISGLVFTTLCLIGALQMRKLKKSGFPLYTIGELAPLAVSVVLFGSTLLSGIGLIFFVLGIIIALLFVVLYSTTRKYLVN